jgi:hypothetical protein
MLLSVYPSQHIPSWGDIYILVARTSLRPLASRQVASPWASLELVAFRAERTLRYFLLSHIRRYCGSEIKYLDGYRCFQHLWLQKVSFGKMYFSVCLPVCMCLCMYICMYGLMDMHLTSAWMARRILFIFGILGFIHPTSVPDEYKHFWPKIRGPSNIPQNTTATITKDSVQKLSNCSNKFD